MHPSSILLIIFLFNWNSTEEKVNEIETIFNFNIPECYVEVDNPTTKFQHIEPHTIVELKFEDSCFWNMYNEGNMTHPYLGCGKYYIGTTWWSDPAWRNDSAKALMYLDLDSCILHFEDYD